MSLDSNLFEVATIRIWQVFWKPLTFLLQYGFLFCNFTDVSRIMGLLITNSCLLWYHTNQDEFTQASVYYKEPSWARRSIFCLAEDKWGLLSNHWLWSGKKLSWHWLLCFVFRWYTYTIGMLISLSNFAYPACAPALVGTRMVIYWLSLRTSQQIFLSGMQTAQEVIGWTLGYEIH